jgi:hypothetical protein
MAALAERAREALAARFGPAWKARTTEEVAGSAELAAELGPETLARLVAFLQDADRAKFAGAADHGPEWYEWVAAFAAGPAGASSRINGR